MPADSTTSATLTGTGFRRRFYTLILLAWTVPPVFGLSFLLYIQIFSLQQMGAILTTPIEPIFVTAALAFALIYFSRFSTAISSHLEHPTDETALHCLRAMRRFSLHFWGIFLLYLLLAPGATILSAELYTDYQATPVDWFRIHLVALIVSIIVGLPIYFRTLDLFGRCLGDIKLQHPHITLKAKVFMIGALMPLLVDTMIVQYYWTRTGFFSSETFIIWLTLELLAIASSLIFTHSLDQSLAPLQGIIGAPSRLTDIDINTLKPCSTDEIGVLTTAYHQLLSNTQAHNAILKLNNRLLTGEDQGATIDDVAKAIIDMCTKVFAADIAYIMLHDELHNELVGVIQSGTCYQPDGHYRLSLDATALSVWAFKHGHTLAIDDVHNDPRVNQAMRERFDAISAMATPMMLGGKAMGILMVSNSVRRHHYTADDITLLEDFAREAALAVHTQRLKEKRLLAEARSREQTTRVRLLLESTGEGIIGVDKELRCTFSNRAAAELLGYTTDELQGKDFHPLIQPQVEDGHEMPRESSLVLCAITKGLSLSSDAEVFWHKGGNSIPVQFQASPIHEDNSITGAVVVFRDIAESRAMAQRMDYLATHDSLTGLFNRYEFERHLQLALESARALRIEHVLCYLDLDQFKVVNDTCGHVAGDELLRQLTTLLSKKVRHNDALARLGGDEFGVLLDSCPLGKALELVEDLRHSVEGFRFVWEGKNFTIGVSIGVMPINADTENLAHALSAADSACYVAKDRGRNRIHVYQATDEDLSQRHGEMQWVSRIHDALSQNRFQLRFQSIAPTHQPQDLHHFFEVLLIMLSEDGQPIPPGAFIPAAERYNLMPAIDRWVIRKTFTWLQHNRAQLTQVTHCSINLSGHSINQDNFLGFIHKQMKDHAIDPEQICFEITETAAVANLCRASEFINKLRSEGCHFALDDFGSGMSSFAYLKNLPVDFLKIDGNFVRDMANNPIDRAMVEAIHQVGHVMGLKTIAEFVEDDAILRHLQRIGVDYAQGYGIGKPRPIDEFILPTV